MKNIKKTVFNRDSNLSVYGIILKFIKKIFSAIKWISKKLFSYSFIILKDILLTKPMLLFKTYKVLRIIIKTIWSIIGTTVLLSWNMFGLQDYATSLIDVFKGLGIVTLLRNLGIIDAYKYINIKIIEIYNKLFTNEEITNKLQKKVSDKLEDKNHISRKDYKNAIEQLKEDEWWHNYMAKITIAIIIAIIIIFFGSDIANFFKFGLNPDDGPEGGDDQEKVEEVKTVTRRSKGKSREAPSGDSEDINPNTPWRGWLYDKWQNSKPVQTDIAEETDDKGEGTSGLDNYQKEQIENYSTLQKLKNKFSNILTRNPWASDVIEDDGDKEESVSSGEVSDFFKDLNTNNDAPASTSSADNEDSTSPIDEPATPSSAAKIIIPDINLTNNNLFGNNNNDNSSSNDDSDNEDEEGDDDDSDSTVTPNSMVFIKTNSAKLKLIKLRNREKKFNEINNNLIKAYKDFNNF